MENFITGISYQDAYVTKVYMEEADFNGFIFYPEEC